MHKKVTESFRERRKHQKKAILKSLYYIAKKEKKSEGGHTH